MKKKLSTQNQKKPEIAEDLGCSSSILGRLRKDINMHSPYRIQPNIHKGSKRFQIMNMTSKDLK